MPGEALELRFGSGLDKKVEGHFGAVLAEMAFAVAGLLFGIGQGHGRDPDVLLWLFSNLGAGREARGCAALATGEIAHANAGVRSAAADRRYDFLECLTGSLMFMSQWY
jgi:hypothetical protein